MDPNKRLKEINEQMNLLRAERNKIEEEMRDELKKKEQDEKIPFVGKCYKIKKSALRRDTYYPYLVAFKILDVNINGDSRDARCVCVHNGLIKMNCGLGIKNEVVSLWSFAAKRMIYKPNEPRLIDNFQEITEDEFNEILNNTLEDIKTKTDFDNNKKFNIFE